ncbi:MAG: molybdopterin-dependent oxidoreductase [Candidatus Rokubacteria bacterium]|nr:molybdopterin-dependent oxidoreductase [Candidatus Rokubacteria bacterium]
MWAAARSAPCVPEARPSVSGADRAFTSSSSHCWGGNAGGAASARLAARASTRTSARRLTPTFYTRPSRRRHPLRACVRNPRPMGARLSHPRIPRQATFKKGLENLGYGVKDTDEYAAQPPGWAAYKPFADQAQAMSFDDYRAFLETYTPEYAAEVSGVPAGQIGEIARLFANPKRKGMSLWTMGFNQHVRGTWINNLVDNLHLLTGKISEPGNGPFSLTGQPSACGTTRETGALPPFEKTRPK